MPRRNILKTTISYPIIERLYLVSPQVDSGKTIADLVAIINDVPGVKIVRRGQASIEFSASLQTKKRVCLALGDDVTVDKPSTFRPARRRNRPTSQPTANSR